MPELPLAKFVDALLDHAEPITEKYCGEGHRAFGACIVRKSDLSKVVASSNRFQEFPCNHGEVMTLKCYFELPEADRPKQDDCYFLSTHEPCFMCLGSLTWCGFKEIFYMFSYADSTKLFNIPHDEIFLKDIFGVQDYRHENSFWSCRHLPTLAKGTADEEAVLKKCTELQEKYVRHGETHQRIYQGADKKCEAPTAESTSA